MAHTPGPWHEGHGNGEGAIFADEGRMRMGPNGTTLYPICKMVQGWEAVEDADNARLIAAAPDLLEALVALVNLQAGRTNWPEVKAAEKAIEKATSRLNESQKAVLAELREKGKHWIAEVTREHWQRGEPYYIDDRVDVGSRLRRRFELCNPRGPG